MFDNTSLPPSNAPLRILVCGSSLLPVKGDPSWFTLMALLSIISKPDSMTLSNNF